MLQQERHGWIYASASRIKTKRSDTLLRDRPENADNVSSKLAEEDAEEKRNVPYQCWSG